MNGFLQLLLLSTAATYQLSKYQTSGAAHSTPTQNQTLLREERHSLSCKADTHKMLRQEISRNQLLTALRAADQAIGMSPDATGPFSLPALDYDYMALEPYIDAETLRIHHNGHHRTYVNDLNAALSDYPDAYALTLNELLLFPDRLPSNIQAQVTQNAGGHYNHSLMWKTIGPQKNRLPQGTLATAIDTQFGSFENFKQAFATAAESVFGSGYAYLILNPAGRLLIVTSNNQTTPIPLRSIPLLPLDVWEHAYYLKYQNKRTNYIDAYMNLIHWENVGKRFEAAQNVFKNDTL